MSPRVLTARSVLLPALLLQLGCLHSLLGAVAVPLHDSYQFDKTISREVLESYLSRSITMEGLLNGRGDLDDNIRMLKAIGAKFIGRSLCLWGGEARLLANLERAKQQLPKVRAADPDMILQACIFEIVTTQVEQVPVPDWAFAAFGLPVEKRNFRYADMLYPNGRFKDHWRSGQSVPDVSRPETKLWFYYLGASFIDVGCEAIHLGQTELMNGNDRNLEHYSQVLGLIRSYAAQHARRHMVLLDSHVPSGGLVRQGQLLMDFHSFPLRIMEVPDKPQEAILKLGFSDCIYGRSKGGRTFSGWTCEHLPYLVEIDNWGVSRQPGQPKAGGIWIWGYDEITWFAHQNQQYRSNWLRYARDWVQRTDPNGHLQMPGSRTMVSPLDGKRWYYANRPSPAVPEGLGDEDAIRAIWAGNRRPAPPQFSAWGTSGPELKAIPARWKPAPPEASPLSGRAFSPEEVERGFAVFAQEPFAYVQLPAESSSGLVAVATPGSYEPVALGIYGLDECSGLQADVSALHSVKGNSIPAEYLDVRVSRAVPVVVDAAVPSYRWEPFLLEKRPEFALARHEARLVWITVHVPQDTPAGTYEGSLSVLRLGHRAASAKVSVSVLPFRLPELPFEPLVYFPRPAESDPMLERELIDMREHGACVPIPAMEVKVKSRDQKFGPDDINETVSYSQRLLKTIYRVYGNWRFPVTFEAGHQIVYYWDQSRNWFSYWPHSSALERDLATAIDLIQSLAKSNNVPALRAYLSDEGGAHNLLDETVYYNRWVKERFPQIQTTATIGGGMALGFDEIGQLSKAVDFFSANRFTPEVAQALTALRRPFGVYNGAGATPAGARYFFGFYGYKTGAQQIGQWAYSFGESIFSGNGLRLEDEGYVYHATDGPLPSIQWEAVREGIYDSRYVELLRSLIEAGNASVQPGAREAARHAQDTLNRIWAGIGWDFQPMKTDQKVPAPPASALRQWRSQISEEILALQKCEVQPSANHSLPRLSALDVPWAPPHVEEATFGPEMLTNSTLEAALSPWRVEAWKGSGKGEVDSTHRHSGSRSVRLQVPASDGNSAVTVLVWPRYGDNKIDLALEGGRTYEFSVWTKWEGRNLPPEVRLNVASSVLAATRTGQSAPDAQGWRRLWTRAKLKANARPDYLAVWMQGPGTVWLDDLSLREVLAVGKIPKP